MIEDTLVLLDDYIKNKYKTVVKNNRTNNPLLKEPIQYIKPIMVKDETRKNKNDIIYQGLLNKWNLVKLKEELGLSNYILSSMDLKDVIISFFFEKEIYDFDILNKALVSKRFPKFQRVGYQGLLFSNSYFASLRYFKEDNIIFVPLLDSKTVVDKLLSKEIEYGVMAKENSIAGEVIETKEAIKNFKYNLIDTIDLEIHHSIFKRKDVDLKELKYVASHIQALLQTKNNRLKLIPDLKEIELKDTAIAAIDLANLKLGKDVCIICNQMCGYANNLELVYPDIEDLKNNKTSFIIVSL